MRAAGNDSSSLLSGLFIRLEQRRVVTMAFEDTEHVDAVNKRSVKDNLVAKRNDSDVLTEVRPEFAHL